VIRSRAEEAASTLRRTSSWRFIFRVTPRPVMLIAAGTAAFSSTAPRSGRGEIRRPGKYLDSQGNPPKRIQATGHRRLVHLSGYTAVITRRRAKMHVCTGTWRHGINHTLAPALRDPFVRRCVTATSLASLRAVARSVQHRGDNVCRRSALTRTWPATWRPLRIPSGSPQ